MELALHQMDKMMVLCPVSPWVQVGTTCLGLQWLVLTSKGHPVNNLGRSTSYTQHLSQHLAWACHTSRYMQHGGVSINGMSYKKETDSNSTWLLLTNTAEPYH